jgi:endonuclease/exonuclease/phosphatase (EEP) superfamily protein YafD
MEDFPMLHERSPLWRAAAEPSVDHAIRRLALALQLDEPSALAALMPANFTWRRQTYAERLGAIASAITGVCADIAESGERLVYGAPDPIDTVGTRD